MSVSFGVEFEFDYIKRTGEIIILRGSPPLFLSNGWDYQTDYTASTELRSPVFTSYQQFIEECNRQFGEMISRNDNIIPYMCNNPRYRRESFIGQHMHIGKPNMRLGEEARVKIAGCAIDFYPFLASIQAQPIPSIRGLNTIHARCMAYYRRFIDFSDHYAEISGSSHGTVEFRIFDANVPQASLVCAFFLTNIAKKALHSRDSENNNSGNYNWDSYVEERTRALRFGLVSLDVTNYLIKFKELVGNIDIPDIPCLKEALYLLAKYRLNFFGLWKYVNARDYDYFRACLSDVSKYLENILSIREIRHEEKVRRWINEARRIENLDQLIGLSMAFDEIVREHIFGRIEERIEQNPELARVVEERREEGLTRSEVREAIERGYYRICRIREVYGLSADQVAEIISNWLRAQGDGFVNVMSAREIIDSPSRFYVLEAYNPITNRRQLCGAVAINRRSGEIHSLVVDRRFRRLGIARLLVEYALHFLREEGLDRAYAWIRKNNEASTSLFRSLGFEPIDRNERSVLYAISLRSE